MTAMNVTDTPKLRQRAASLWMRCQFPGLRCRVLLRLGRIVQREFDIVESLHVCIVQYFDRIAVEVIVSLIGSERK